MRSDSDIKRDVEDELRWEPNLDPTDIAVAVKNGVVTLTGSVNSQARRSDIEKAAAGVPNVKQVVNELQVKNQKATGRGGL